MTKAVHSLLDDFCSLVNDIACQSTQISKLVVSVPVLLEACDAVGPDMAKFPFISATELSYPEQTLMLYLFYGESHLQRKSKKD